MPRLVTAAGLIVLTIMAAVIFQLTRLDDLDNAGPSSASSKTTTAPASETTPSSSLQQVAPATIPVKPPVQRQDTAHVERRTTNPRPKQQSPNQAKERESDNLAKLRACMDAQPYFPRQPNASLHLHVVLSKWAAADPIGMMAWYRENYEQSESTPAFGDRNIVGALARKDFDAAMEYAQLRAAAKPSSQSDVYPMIASQTMYTEGVEKTISWLDRIGSEGARDKANLVVVEHWSRKQPHEAMNWASQLKNQGHRDRAVTAAASRLMRSNPEEAMNRIMNSGISEGALAHFELSYRKLLTMKALKADNKRLKEAYDEK